MKKIISLSFSLILFTQLSIAQTDFSPLDSDTVSISKQYNFIMDESRTYVNNKVIKTEWIKKFYENVADSLSSTYKNNKELKNVLDEKDSKLIQVQTELENTKEELITAQNEKDSLTLFGSTFTKSGYQTTTWVIIIILLVLLGFFLYKFKESISTTKHAKKELILTQEELESTKKKALIKEQEIMRKLQDEINKHAS